MFQQNSLGYFQIRAQRCFKVWEYPLRTKAALSRLEGQNILRHRQLERYTDKLKTTKRQLERYIYLPNCLKVVWKLSVSEYILTFQTGEYCLSTALVRRGYSHTLNHLRTLNTFVETFFSPDSFGLAFSFFLSCVFRQIKSFP